MFFLLIALLIIYKLSGVQWVPELLDHHTDEWQRLAKDVKDEVCITYLSSHCTKYNSL